MSVRLMGRKAYFGFLIPSPFNFRCDWRVFQAVFLSYTLANRRLVPYLASYTRFHVLHRLQRGYRHPVLRSHTLLLHSTNFPEGTASTFDFNIPFSHLTSDINKKAQSNSSQVESSALCLGNWLFFYDFILLLKWNFPFHGAFRKFFPCFL